MRKKSNEKLAPSLKKKEFENSGNSSAIKREKQTSVGNKNDIRKRSRG